MNFDVEGLTFDRGKHAYTCNGVVLTSVTTLIKTFKKPFDAEAQSVKSAKKANKERAAELGVMVSTLGERGEAVTPEGLRREWDTKSRESRRNGTAAHRVAEDLALGREALLSNFYHPAVAAFFDEHDVKPLAVEQMVAWPAKRLAGTIDLLAEVDGQLTLVDYKTNAEIRFTGYGRLLEPLDHLPACEWSEYSLQMALYAAILAGQYGCVVDRCALVHLPKEGGYRMLYPDPSFYEWEIEQMLEAVP